MYYWNQPDPGLPVWTCPEHGLTLIQDSPTEFWLRRGNEEPIFIEQPMQFDSLSRMWVTENPLNSIADPFESPRVVQLGPYHFSGGNNAYQA